MEKINRIIDIINWGQDYLQKKGIESARLQIEILLSKITNLKRIELYTNFDKPLLDNELIELKEFIKRIVNNEPIQYIINESQFLDLKLYVDKNVLIPRPETEELVNMIIKENREKENLKILDIGTGSGCIGLGLSKSLKNAEVIAIDISKEALKVAEKNQLLNKISNIKFYDFDILTKIPKSKFDIIVSNPPYIPISEIDSLDKNVKDFEPLTALTDNADGMKFYDRFSEIFNDMLNLDGKFYCEIHVDNSKKIFERFNVNNYQNLEIIKDLFKKERFLVGVKG